MVVDLYKGSATICGVPLSGTSTSRQLSARFVAVTELPLDLKLLQIWGNNQLRLGNCLHIFDAKAWCNLT